MGRRSTPTTAQIGEEKIEAGGEEVNEASRQLERQRQEQQRLLEQRELEMTARAAEWVEGMPGVWKHGGAERWVSSYDVPLSRRILLSLWWLLEGLLQSLRRAVSLNLLPVTVKRVNVSARSF
jgi:hypothetical protein